MTNVEKYSDLFLKLYDKENNKGNTIRTIIEVEKSTGVEILQWDDNVEVIIFLKKFGSVSPMALSMKMVCVRKFADLICKKEKLPKRIYNLDDNTFLSLVDKEQLKSITLNYQQYLEIKSQLDIIDENGNSINIRDKVIFSLAFLGLLSDEIRSLHEKDIEFEIADNKMEVAILTVGERIIRVDDSELVEDIHKCLLEEGYSKKDENGWVQVTKYKESDYLCKPINVGRPSTKLYLNSPNLALQRIFKKDEVTCQGINMASLSLTDIRRSRLILLLAPENEDLFDIRYISNVFNLDATASLYWLRQISREFNPIKRKQ